MITNITLENFKCFREVSINPKLLTVLIGPNGTGKSSILQALLLLKQSLGEERIRHRGNAINLSSKGEILPRFDFGRRRIGIFLAGKLLGTEDLIEFSYGTRFPPLGRLFDNYGNVSLRNEDKYLEITVDRNSRNSKARVRVNNSQMELERGWEVGALVKEEANVSRSGSSGSSVEEIIDETFGISSVPNEVLGNISFVPSVRGLVRPTYQLGDRRYNDISLSEGLSAQEEQTASNLGYSRALEGRLSSLVQRVTRTELTAETVPPQSVEIKSLLSKGSVNIVSEGFGSNSLILLFHQLVSAEDDATVLIEEPEIHLHPKAQAELAEVLAETAKAEDKQIIMTTHSEHLVERLLLLVAEGTLKADDLAVYSFSKDEKGECFAAEIEVTENGQVEGGLTDFYANNLDTLDRRVKALKRSQ